MFASIRSTPLAALLFLSITPFAHAADYTADSHVSVVTVYSDRATVTRTAQVNVTSGDHVAVITDLPSGLIPDSIRAEGHSTAAVVLGAIENKIVNSAELAAPRERELRLKMQDLQDQRALIVAEQASLKSRQAFLDKIGTAAATRVNEDITNTVTLKPDEWLSAAEKVFGATRDTNKAAQAQIVLLRQIDENIGALQAELDQIQTGSKQTYTVKIPFASQGDGALTLNIQYQIYGAGWRPLYDARLDTASRAFALMQFGEVRQTTGEDWNDAKLTLSTAQPSRGATPPNLYTQWLSIFDPNVNYRQNAEIGMMDAMSSNALKSEAMPMVAAAPSEMAGDGGALQEAKAAVFQTAQIETGGYVAEYKIPGTISVPSDNSAKKVMIQKLDVTAALLTQVRPALDSNVYLIARTKLGGESPLLPGMVNLFRDNAFIGSTQQPMLRPGEETDLAFGVDDQVVMKRQTLVNKNSESGLVSTQSTQTRVVETEIQNLHTFGMPIEVLESVPVSQDERIKVEIDDRATTAGYTDSVQKITGLKRWAFNLEPQAKQSIQLGWSVTWPKSMQINGL